MRLISRTLLLGLIALAAGCVVVPVGPPRPAYYGPRVYVQPYGYGYYHHDRDDRGYYGDHYYH